MPARKYIFAIISMFVLVLLSLEATSVYACSIPTPSPTPPNFTFEDYVNDAPYIFVGTIVENFSSDYGGYSVIDEIEVEVETYLRGQGSTIVRIKGFGCVPECCSYGIPIGNTLANYAAGRSI